MPRVSMRPYKRGSRRPRLPPMRKLNAPLNKNSTLKGFIPRGGPPTVTAVGEQVVYITRTKFYESTGTADNNITDGDFNQTANRQWALVSVRAFGVSNVGALKLSVQRGGGEATNAEGTGITDFFFEGSGPKCGIYIPKNDRTWQISGTVFNTTIASFTVQNYIDTALEASSKWKVVVYATFAVKF